MSWEQLAAGLQVVAIITIVVGACIAPMISSFFRSKE